MQQGHVRLGQLEVFVLDEADRMLDMGFLPDVRRIIAQLPRQRQSVFLSATIPKEVAALADTLLRSPVRVTVSPPASTVEKIDQRVFYVERRNKRALLHELLQTAEASRVLVFTRTKRGADNVARQLSQSGIQALAIHGGKSQSNRERALQSFRVGRVRVLVATDLAARGIHVEAISHVINYDMPLEPEGYVHRIGRTGRAGACGTALSLCDDSERVSLRAIERLLGQKISVRVDHAFHRRSGPATGSDGDGSQSAERKGRGAARRCRRG
jgi:ATP-dependent RNA helicase RhlE